MTSVNDHLFGNDYILPNTVPPEQRKQHTIEMLMAEIKILTDQVKRLNTHQVALAKRLDALEGMERR